MPNFDEIFKIKKCLKHVRTRITKEDGMTFDEARTSDGFEVVFDDKNDGEQGTSTFIPSNRMKKDLSRTMPNGYILDPNPNLEVNEIVDGIYISSQDVAHDLEILESNGITHIVNVATGIPNYFERNFKYLSIQALDNPNENLKKHFVKAVKFMRKAVEEGGRVLVHCNAGISRSTSIVIAYIIYYKNKRFQEAYEMVKKNHPATQPNLGFILQLKEFENELPLHS